MTYKLLKQGVQRIADGACIPPSTDNMDWVRYQEWLAAGGIPQAADPELKPTPVLTLVEQILSSPNDLAALKKALGI